MNVRPERRVGSDRSVHRLGWRYSGDRGRVQDDLTYDRDYGSLT